MTPYLFQGLVLPERAQLSLQFGLRFTHVSSEVDAEARVSVVLNQVAIWIYSEIEWDIFDLRNVVKHILQTQLAVVGYLTGYAYDFEIRRVLHPELEIDYVFGIDVPCIAERNKAVDVAEKLTCIRQKLTGAEGVLLNRCFNDLVMAMKHPDDTAFYCYRAIESLRQHCARRFKIDAQDKSDQ